MLYSEMLTLGYKFVEMTKPWQYIDAEVVENMECPHCHMHLVYEGYESPASYLAFGICQKCNYQVEI